MISGYNIWISLVGGISWMMSDGFTSSILIGLLGGLFIITILFFRDQYLLTLFKNTSVGSDKIRTCIGLLFLIDQYRKFRHDWLFGLYSFISYHNASCSDQMCPFFQLENKRQKNGHYNKQDMFILLPLAIIRKVKAIVAANPNELDYYWFAIGYLLENTKSYVLSLELITSVAQKEMSVFQRFILYCHW